jgi:hypothetical protein
MPTQCPITNREKLLEYLQVAIGLEHATIPPYLTALYSIKPVETKTNFDAASVIRTVLVEEMLHLTLAANLLNAIGGKPDLTHDHFVPSYPTVLPTGQDDFYVSLTKFSPKAVETFLKIERPAPEPKPSDENVTLDGVRFLTRDRLVGIRAKRVGLLPSLENPHKKGELLHFYSIGEFYKAIIKGIRYVSNDIGESKLFNGDPAKQIGPEHYYSGGGEIVVVTDLASAEQAMNLIADQGEGYGGGIGAKDGELSHFYRFQQIELGRHYRIGDQKGVPTGDELEVHYDEVHAILPNAKVANYPVGSEVREAAVEFNRFYKSVLAEIEAALNGKPEMLAAATGRMRQIRFSAERLMHVRIPGTDAQAAPTFELDDKPPPSMERH